MECRAFPTLSTIANVVIDDSIHKMAAIASNPVTSFLNISLACAIIEMSSVRSKEILKTTVTTQK